MLPCATADVILAIEFRVNDPLQRLVRRLILDEDPFRVNQLSTIDFHIVVAHHVGEPMRLDLNASLLRELYCVGGQIHKDVRET